MPLRGPALSEGVVGLGVRRPRTLSHQALLSLGSDCGASDAKHIAHGAKVSDSAYCSARENLVAACTGDTGTLSKSVDGQICVLQTLL